MAGRLSSNCFTIANYNGKAVLFRTDDVTVNKFTFKVINLTGERLFLKGGTPDRSIRDKLVSVSDASTFTFDFESMLTTGAVAGLNLTLPENWAAAFSPGSFSAPPSWSLAPTIDVTMGVNEEIPFGIENIKCADTAPGNFEIMYRNIPGYDDRTIPILKHLDVLNPPDPNKKPLPLKDGYINPVHPIAGQQIFDTLTESSSKICEATEAVPIYITYDPAALIENGFTYILTNTSKNPLVSDPVAGEPPALYISFVFGDEDYAITTQNLADNNISIDVSSKLPWQSSKHIGGSAYWRFLPQSTKIMGGLETIYFPIKKIITPLNVRADDISIMYVQLNNIPGYNDGAYTVQMQKKTAEAAMEKLESDKRVINYGENIRLTWVSSLAKRVTIAYETRDKQHIILDSEKGEIKLNGTDFLLPAAPSAEYTVIRATAYDNSLKTSGREVTITVNQVQVTIRAFTATPQLVNLSSKADVVLSWETENAQRLLLITPEGQQDVTGKTSIPIRLTEGFTFTLEAWSYGTHFPAPVKAWRKVFAWEALNAIPLARTRDIMQVQPAVLFNQKTARVYTQNAVAGNIYNINSNTSRLEQTLPGIGIVLSDDGTKLFSFVNDGAFYAAVMFDVSAGIAAEKARVQLIYEYVYQMLVSPDVTKLFCTVAIEHRGKYWERYLVVINIDTANNTMKIGEKMWLGPNNFRSLMAFNGDASKLYVSWERNYVQVARTSDMQWIGSFPSVNPAVMVCSRPVRKLYLAFLAENSLTVADTITDRVTNTIEIGNRPANIVLSPDGRYLCVACFDSDKVIIVDTESDEVISSLTVGKNPFGMCFGNDGKMLLVSNYCSKSMSVVDFANREVLQPELETGINDGNPFAVAAVDDDGKCNVYVTKESWPSRINCAKPAENTNDSISIFSILSPANIKPV